MGKEKRQIIKGEYHHVFNKTIAGFKVFNNEFDYKRMIEIIDFYRIKQKYSFSTYNDRGHKDETYKNSSQKDKQVEVYAYCIMPTHFHFLLKEIIKNGISEFMGKIQKSYATYFNNKYKRKGPLWQGRYKNVKVSTDEQLYYLTQYIHLNPVKATLVKDPFDWVMSSCRDFLVEKKDVQIIDSFNKVLDISSKEYKKEIKSFKDSLVLNTILLD
ncbi:MAG: transposase [Candidatus Omnitrophica bacterium]|nr:transposase [Candidatus Omnitrophota bacterium]MDD5080836.1 transposase [Candidatus Omnitrophota bacterium]